MFEQSKQGAVDVIRGELPLNYETAGALSEILEQCLAHGQPRVVFDMEHVPLLDSAGLELLVEVQENYQRRGGSLRLAMLNPLCREILEVTGVDRSLETFPDSSTAVGSFVQ